MNKDVQVGIVLADIEKWGGLDEFVRAHAEKPDTKFELKDERMRLVTLPVFMLAESLRPWKEEGRRPEWDEVFQGFLPGSTTEKSTGEAGARYAVGAPGFEELLEMLAGGGFGGDGGDFGLAASLAASRRNGKSDGKRPKGYAPWKPQKKTEVLLEQIKEVLDDYQESLPLTGRQIFYRLVGAYGYPKDENAYERLTDKLVRARRAGIIPFDHIRDDGSSTLMGTYYTGEDEFYRHIRELAEAYERNKLANQEADIRVYCEAAGMMPQLERVTHDYSVGVFSCSGYDSLTFKYELFTAIKRAFIYRGRRTVVLHLGDYDPSGENIFDVIEEDVHEFLRRDVSHKRPEEVAMFERLALTSELVEDYDLPTEPPKAKDSRTKKWAGETCQLEALPPDLLAEVLREGIEEHLDLSILETDRKTEKEERQKITLALPSG